MPIFVGPGVPINPDGFEAATTLNGIETATLWSVLSVETSGCGFMPDRRPKILFERHYFHRLTGGKFDAVAPDVSAPSAGGYGAPGAHQYDWLQVALKLNQSAAMQSCSWGLGQVMGANYAIAGFPNVDTLVADMAESENAQLSGMASFIRGNSLHKKLQVRDWAGFARGYNGPDYAAHNYHIRLQEAYARFSGGNMPDLTIRGCQAYLTYRAFNPGEIDGVIGDKTVAAAKAFQKSIHVPVTGKIDASLLRQLAAE